MMSLAELINQKETTTAYKDRIEKASKTKTKVESSSFLFQPPQSSPGDRSDGQSDAQKVKLQAKEKKEQIVEDRFAELKACSAQKARLIDPAQKACLNDSCITIDFGGALETTTTPNMKKHPSCKRLVQTTARRTATPNSKIMHSERKLSAGNHRRRSVSSRSKELEDAIEKIRRVQESVGKLNFCNRRPVLDNVEKSQRKIKPDGIEELQNRKRTREREGFGAVDNEMDTAPPANKQVCKSGVGNRARIGTYALHQAHHQQSPKATGDGREGLAVSDSKLLSSRRVIFRPAERWAGARPARCLFADEVEF